MKTVSEAHRIPTVQENVDALIIADRAARAIRTAGVDHLSAEGEMECAALLNEAERLVEAVLQLSDDVSKALLHAFAAGLLDVPYCLHPDNHGDSKAYIAEDGRLRWSNVGRMPISAASAEGIFAAMTSTALLRMLRRTADGYDAAGVTGRRQVDDV